MMLNNNKVQSESQQGLLGDSGKSRKSYRKPKLEVLGDLRTLTLGASPSGTKDSGGGLLYEKLGLLPIPGFPQPDGSILRPDGTLIPPGG
jgi:hypothetical protein